MPYIVLEALAAGKTMVSTGVGGIPEIFPAGSPALVQPDAEALAGAMVRVLADPEACARLMPSRQELKARFSAEVMAAQIVAAYEQALAALRR